MTDGYLDIEDIAHCIKGDLYMLKCRNLRIGVFDGADAFIGIRTKFERRYLDSEYVGKSGTVREAIPMGVSIPADVPAPEFGRDNPALFDLLDKELSKLPPLPGWK